MTKLFSASLLAFGVMTAASSATASGFGGSLYIQDSDKSIVLFAGQYGEPGWSLSIHSSVVSIATIDSNGNIVDDWIQLFVMTPSLAPNQSGQLMVTWSNPDLKKPGSANYLEYKPSSDAYEVVFMWTNESTGETYYSDVLGLNNGPLPHTFVSHGHTNVWDKDTWSTIGLEHNDGAAGPGGLSWDWNDVYITMTNVGATGRPIIPTIPEPETYAMMLSGLAIVGSVVRRRRNRVM